MRSAAAKTLTVLGAIALFLGILAGLVNRNVLDGPRFARHVDAIRSNPAVAQQVGTRITDQLVALQPDLVAIRPLVQTTAVTLVGSSAFSSVVRESAVQLHGAFTGKDNGQVVLRLADAGAVLVGVLKTVAPDVAARLPSNLDVTLADVGSQTFAARTIHFARTMGLLSWLLPLLAAVLFAGGVVLARERWPAVVHTGMGIAASGAAVGLVASVVSVIVSRSDTATLRGAITVAAWHEVRGSLWWAAGLVLVAGCVLAVAAAGLVPRLDIATLTRRTWAVVTARPANRWALFGHGLLVGVIAVGILFRPALTFGVIGALIGLLLLTVGVAEVAAAGGVARPRPAADDRPRGYGRSRRWLLAIVPAAAIAVVVALVVVDAVGVNRSVAAPARVTQNPNACNGFVELCDRPYNEVAYPATHNSMTAADENWFLPEQPDGVIGQLNAGIRVFLIDSWYGETTTRRGLIATAPQNYAAALEAVRQEYGAATVESALRLRGALLPKAVGPPTPYLCHGLCELGAIQWEPLMVQVRQWMQAHPREVLTFFVEDNVSPDDTAKVFEQAGLTRYAYQPPGNAKTWPTLGQMIDSGKRLVVLMERHGGGAKYPWLLQGFDEVQDTPFTTRTVADLSCALNRGKPDNPLLLLNYWLNGFQSLVSNATKVNAYDILWPYVQECRAQRGHIPNYLAVNYYNRGALFRVVDQLNGVS